MEKQTGIDRRVYMDVKEVYHECVITRVLRTDYVFVHKIVHQSGDTVAIITRVKFPHSSSLWSSKSELLFARGGQNLCEFETQGLSYSDLFGISKVIQYGIERGIDYVIMLIKSELEKIADKNANREEFKKPFIRLVDALGIPILYPGEETYDVFGEQLFAG